MAGLPYVSRPPEATRRVCPSGRLRKALARWVYKRVVHDDVWVLVNESNRLMCVITPVELDYWRVGAPFAVSDLEPGPYFMCPIDYMYEGYPERGIPVPARLIRAGVA